MLARESGIELRQLVNGEPVLEVLKHDGYRHACALEDPRAAELPGTLSTAGHSDQSSAVIGREAVSASFANQSSRLSPCAIAFACRAVAWSSDSSMIFMRLILSRRGGLSVASTKLRIRVTHSLRVSENPVARPLAYARGSVSVCTVVS
jgi:hypothetical protein